jgi:phosphate transport system protein
VKPHTLSSFDDDLEAIQTQIMRMGGLVEEAISKASEALETRDAELARTVRAGDTAVDQLEEQVNQAAARIIALRQPAASDLRTVLTVFRVSANLERIGDYAKNIAKRTMVVAQAQPIAPAVIVPEMARAVVEIIRDTLDAFVDRDAAKANAILSRDQQVDEYYNALFRSLLTFMMENPHYITPSTHLLFVAKNLERIGDHATSVAEMIYFTATGQRPAERPKNDFTSTIYAPSNPGD